MLCYLLLISSDVIAIFSCNVIFIMVMSRFYLKEKLTIVHMLAVLVILSGVMLIAQPSFLIHKTGLTYNDTSMVIAHSNQTTSGFSMTVTKAIGYSLAAFSGMAYAIITILIKTSQKFKTHFSILNLFASYFGLPVSLGLSIASIATGYTHKDVTFLSEPEFVWDTFFAVTSVLMGKMYLSLKILFI